MQHLLNLLAAIALLVWGTHTVRTGILRVMGGSLRDALSSSVRKPVWAFASGVGVSSLLQSSTATCLIVSSFVGQGLFLTSTALIMMLGADVGTSLMALLFSFDMSWLSPLLIVVGVVTFVTNQNNTAGRWGRVAIGLGLMTLALRLIVEATRPITESQGMHVLLSVLPNDPLILMLVGAFLTVISYSSLAMVLLTATLCHTGVLSLSMALGLVLGANLGSGLLAFLTLSKSLPAVRRVPLGNLFFKVIGCMLALPFLSYFPPVAQELQALHLDPVVGFHVMFNLLLTVSLVGLTGKAGAWLALHLPATAVTEGAVQPKYLDQFDKNTIII